MHVIKKQLIELKLSKEQNAFRVQHLISEHYRNEMIPVLESVFNDYCSKEEVLIVDKLEIDFGVISEKDLEKNRWSEDMLAVFKSNLLENLSALSVNKSFTRQSRAVNSCRQWISYMQKGYLPWNTIVVNDKWYQDVLETLATDYSGAAILRKLILNEKTFTYRVALQHDAIFLTKLVEVITAQSQKQLALAVEEIYNIIRQGKIYQYQQPPAVAFIKAIWQQLLIVAAGAEKNLSTEIIVASVLRPYAALLPVQRKQQKELLSQASTVKQTLIALFESNNDFRTNKSLLDKDDSAQKRKKNIPPKKTKNSLAAGNEDTQAANEIKPVSTRKENKKTEKRKKIDKKQQADCAVKNDQALLAPISPAKTITSKDQQEDKLNTKPGIAKDLQQQQINPVVGKGNMTGKILSAETSAEKRKQQAGKSLGETIPAEGIFIQHAGVILAHPFLGSLFRRLQWLQNNQFINDEAQVKAVFILHYLATGETIAAEHELVICKLLCAYPLDEPLPAEIIFTEAELQEATDMLTALIQQWDKLQNTSIAGLREGFLQRSGKLFMKNALPYVQVESNAIDILLDYLPWNISMIRLPWMKELLKAEWR
jgi:hypothetical protein